MAVGYLRTDWSCSDLKIKPDKPNRLLAHFTNCDFVSNVNPTSRLHCRWQCVQ